MALPVRRRWGRGGVGIGNAGVWGRTRIWKSQVRLKGKLLVVCRVAAAAPNPRKQTKEEEQGGFRGVRCEACGAPHLFIFFFFFGPLALICEENGPEMGGRSKAWP